MERPTYELAIYDLKVKDRFLETVGEKAWNKEVIFAIQAMHGSPALQKCSPMSIKSAVVNIALTGATLNPVLQQAFLIPRKGKCCLDFGYRGLCKIATDAGGVIDVDATVVYEKDTFDYEMGLCPYLKHKPCLETDRGEMVFVYAIAILPDNIKKFIVLPKTEIDEIKKTSKAYTSDKESPWEGAFEAEMWRKSAVKKLYKYLPQTERMSTAVHVLNQHEGLKKDEFSTATELMERFEDPLETSPETAINARKSYLSAKMGTMSDEDKIAFYTYCTANKTITVDLLQGIIDNYEDFKEAWERLRSAA